MSVKDINNTDELLKTINSMIKNEVTIGVHGDVGSDIFDRATWNEFGTHDKKGKVLIPERSFIRACFDSEKADINRDMEKIAERVVAGQMKVKTGLNLLGDATKGRVQEYAIRLSTPANKYSTIKKKGSSNPLVDTGQMIGSIDYKVKG
jgi:hypothetical protein